MSYLVGEAGILINNWTVISVLAQLQSKMWEYRGGKYECKILNSLNIEFNC